MSSHITRIEVYPDYQPEGNMDLDLPFSYGCGDLSLHGYTNIVELIEDIRVKLKEEDAQDNSHEKKGCQKIIRRGNTGKSDVYCGQIVEGFKHLCDKCVKTNEGVQEEVYPNPNDETWNLKKLDAETNKGERKSIGFGDNTNPWDECENTNANKGVQNG